MALIILRRVSSWGASSLDVRPSLLVHTGKFPRDRANSVLSPEWESKRLAIAERHNLLVGMVGFLPLTLYLMLSVLAQVLGYREPPSVRIASLLFIVAGEIYGLFRVFRYDEIMCERLGFVCPNCRKPLYEPRSFISINGLCPKCHQRII